MAESKKNDPRSSFEVSCPCCGTRLTVDPQFSKILLTRPPETGGHERQLDHASQTLQKDAARRDLLFERSLEEEKEKSELLERKFQEALKRSKSQPVAPPLHDIDLD
ncbi:MAG TPA: hypothetical protein VFZ08_15405 [Terriglobia bacterium]|nr:hypothetical protein [Terriglobia bacterium]